MVLVAERLHLPVLYVLKLLLIFKLSIKNTVLVYIFFIFYFLAVLKSCKIFLMLGSKLLKFSLIIRLSHFFCFSTA